MRFQKLTKLANLSNSANKLDIVCPLSVGWLGEINNKLKLGLCLARRSLLGLASTGCFIGTV